MSREIKFRAWDVDNKKWIRSFRVYKSGKGLSIYSDKDGSTLGVNVDSSTYILIQFTGLLDKNGKEIYEGDIVNIRFRDNIVGKPKFSWDKGVIKWNEKSSAFKWFSVEEDSSDENNYWLTHADSVGREVIGNVYKNPELLK